MASDHEIGRVVAVDTAQVTIELNRDLKALTRSTYEGTLEVGRINSYIIIPVGARRIVAMVTRVLLTEESELKADKTMVTLPSSRRLMKATMIGTIDEGRFRQGINLFPVLDSPVLITTKKDLDAIFGKSSDQDGVSPDEPGFCIPIGRSAVFQDYDIKIDPDAFFGKHAAIIGSTGSGKSCTIATIIQSIIHQASVKQTRFIILDTNGEYRTAFQRQNGDKAWTDADAAFKALYIPTDPAEKDKLAIPYWFMDSEDFVRLFRASPGVQRPVLLNALSSAREDSQGPSWVSLREHLLLECHRLMSAAANGQWQDRHSMGVICEGVVRSLESEESKEALANLINNFPDLTADSIKKVFQEVKQTAGRKNEKDYDPLVMDVRQAVDSLLNSLLATLVTTPQSSFRSISCSADCPKYFSKHELRYKHLEHAMTRDEASSSRARDNCSTMLMRIYRLLEDSRFEFMFGPTCSEWPSVMHSLATFMRDILGAGCLREAGLTGTDACPEGQLPFYDRQRGGSTRSNVVIIDLSLLASEVLENVTALIGRLIHEFLQRLSDPVSGVGRGEYPVVLILEEAQNYIREGRGTEEDSISKLVFERIAREGRKYGLGLVVASQRPSELSKTVLSQCNSFIVHRLQNPEDLRYFREIVPGIYGQLLDQLPALAPRSALVLGECVQAPALVDMREASPVPKSKNPKFYRSWTQEEKQPDFEAVCERWEGRQLGCPAPADQPHGAPENGGEME
jgi:DNA helicase HerA-like ATPase